MTVTKYPLSNFPSITPMTGAGEGWTLLVLQFEAMRNGLFGWFPVVRRLTVVGGKVAVGFLLVNWVRG